MIDITQIESLCSLVTQNGISTLEIRVGRKEALKIIARPRLYNKREHLSTLGQYTNQSSRMIKSPGVGTWRSTHPCCPLSELNKGDKVNKKDIIGYLKIRELLVPVRANENGIFDDWCIKKNDLVGYGDAICKINLEVHNEAH